MIAADTVIVVPVVRAMPAGFSPSASPPVVDATAAPARDVEIAPEPGNSRPPAAATVGDSNSPVTVGHLMEVASTGGIAAWDGSIAALERVQIELGYEGYLRRQEADAARLQKVDGVIVPADLDYRAIPGLSNEVVEKLEAIRPRSVGQASRISGVTPAAIAILLTHIGLFHRRKAEVPSPPP